MIVRKLRLQRGWSQDQLAQMTALSTRTIQRIERGQKPGLESMKALAAVFEVDHADLSAYFEQEPLMESLSNKSKLELSLEEEKAIGDVIAMKFFYAHLISYLIGIAIMAGINLLLIPDNLWFIWAVIFWGGSVLIHFVSTFNFFSPDWERRQVEKRLGRKL